ncbi:hypothetical protein L484_003169 [Morus notabilis]|uniref:NB-ARC domain-containing protein n=1 Tax=Morus notabilis TaxID=981085 RepID=W9QPU0_9ROSA|nr:hypothetical protein L484_001558 [Morus notabilis]EXC04606.1 hypothetical protein L484_003169 [Morus notabilis]
MKKAIVRKTQKANKFSSNGVSYRPFLRSSISNKGYQSFVTTMPTLRRIMEALKDPNFGVIWVYSMGGVGKTILAKEVIRKAQQERLFHEVEVLSFEEAMNLFNIIAGNVDEKSDFHPLAIEVVKECAGLR